MAVGDIPLPSAPPGSFMQGASAGNALINDMIKNRIGNVQAQYAPYTAYADAASKIAYANMLPYQIQATIMSNPMLWMALKDNPQAMQSMMSNFANSIPKGNNIFGGVNLPNPQQTTGNSLLGMLVNRISGNSQNPMQQAHQEQVNENNITPEMNINSPQQSIPSNASVRPPSALPGSDQNPFFEMKQGTVTSEEQGKANVALWKDVNAEDTNAAIQAQNALNDLNRFTTAYSGLSPLEKGPLLGRLPAVSNSAQIADQAVETLRATLLRQLQTGHITDKDFTVGMNLKPGRYLNPKAEQSISSYMKGVGLRSQEKIAFNNAASNMGLTAPQANLIWTKYISDRPFFDAKNNNLINKNLNSWNDYLAPNKARDILNNVQSQNVSNVPEEKSEKSNFDPLDILDYKFNSPEEFRAAFSTLNKDGQEKVRAEMKRKGMK